MGCGVSVTKHAACVPVTCIKEVAYRCFYQFISHHELTPWVDVTNGVSGCVVEFNLGSYILLTRVERH